MLKYIVEVSDLIKREVKSISKNVDLALRVRNHNKRLADLIHSKNNSSLNDISSIHVELVKEIEKEKKERVDPIPQGMLDMWEWQHEQILEDITEVKMKMETYSNIKNT